MGVGLEPAHQRIAFAILNLVRLGQTPKAGAKPITVAMANSRENSNPCHSGRVCHLLDNIVEQCLDVFEATKNSRETQYRKRRGIDSFRRTVRATFPIRWRRLS